jgi:hypothetical protein
MADTISLSRGTVLSVPLAAERDGFSPSFARSPAPHPPQNPSWSQALTPLNLRGSLSEFLGHQVPRPSRSFQADPSLHRRVRHPQPAHFLEMHHYWLIFSPGAAPRIPLSRLGHMTACQRRCQGTDRQGRLGRKKAWDPPTGRQCGVGAVVS